MSTRRKVFIGLAVWFALALVLFAIFGSDGAGVVHELGPDVATSAGELIMYIPFSKDQCVLHVCYWRLGATLSPGDVGKGSNCARSR